jgi:hypothetical protein
MSDLNRRQMIQTLGAAPIAALTFTWTAEDAAVAAEGAARARREAASQQKPYTPRFFTGAEYATVVALADMILPRDARSVSASEAGTAEFIDYIVA